MPIQKINIEELLSFSATAPILDVRSPGEYAHAHIPGAISFPLFTNDERKIIGTQYKQESRETAVKTGLDYFGKNMVTMVEAAEKIINSNHNKNREVIVHCWRGGMRSAAVSWLLDLYGFKVYTLAGGYKSYRKWALEQFEKPYPIRIIGGYTGSNKTGIIKAIQKSGDSAIDLEGLAGHMGSAFGNLRQIPQPSQEQFENLLAKKLYELSENSPEQTIWIENESRRIGDVNLPDAFFHNFSLSAVYFLEIPFEERLKHLILCYGNESKESLINGIVRITKRLGGLDAKTAINFLIDGDINQCFSILLHYYDKFYRKSEARQEGDRTPAATIICESTDAAINLEKLKQHANRTT